MKDIGTESPLVESSRQRNPCYETTHKHTFALAVATDDGQEYFFGAGQFLDAHLAGNAAIEKGEHAPPERLLIRYATGEIVILGRGLRRVAQMIQRGELESLKALGQRYAGLREGGPMIASIAVNWKAEP